MKTFLIIPLLFISVMAQFEDFVPLNNLEPIRGMVNDAKVLEKQVGKPNTVHITFSPMVRVSVLGSSIEIRPINKDEQVFKNMVPGFFRGRYKGKDHNHVFIQKIQGYTIVHFFNDLLYEDFVREITNNQYVIYSQLMATTHIDKTIYGVVADFQQMR